MVACEVIGSVSGGGCIDSQNGLDNTLHNGGNLGSGGKARGIEDALALAVDNAQLLHGLDSRCGSLVNACKVAEFHFIGIALYFKSGEFGIFRYNSRHCLT